MRNRPRRSDHFTRTAKKQNYPARSIFKLKEIDQKFKLLSPGDSVLDLGCSPGSWLKYTAEQVGAKGVVFGIDRHGLKIDLPTNARYLKHDALDLEPSDLAELYADPFDVVLSDMAPHTSGDRFVDQQRSLRLFLRALELSRAYLKVGGAFLGKIFQSDDLEFARREARLSFQQVKFVRPQATKKQSSEAYLLCQSMVCQPDETPTDLST